MSDQVPKPPPYGDPTNPYPEQSLYEHIIDVHWRSSAHITFGPVTIVMFWLSYTDPRAFAGEGLYTFQIGVGYSSGSQNPGAPYKDPVPDLQNSNKYVLTATGPVLDPTAAVTSFVSSQTPGSGNVSALFYQGFGNQLVASIPADPRDYFSTAYRGGPETVSWDAYATAQGGYSQFTGQDFSAVSLGIFNSGLPHIFGTDLEYPFSASSSGEGFASASGVMPQLVEAHSIQGDDLGYMVPQFIGANGTGLNNLIVGPGPGGAPFGVSSFTITLTPHWTWTPP